MTMMAARAAHDSLGWLLNVSRVRSKEKIERCGITTTVSDRATRRSNGWLSEWPGLASAVGFGRLRPWLPTEPCNAWTPFPATGAFCRNTWSTLAALSKRASTRFWIIRSSTRARSSGKFLIIDEGFEELAITCLPARRASQGSS